MNQKSLEEYTLEELNEIENQIRKIKSKKKNPQKNTDKKKIEAKLKNLLNKYNSIEITANLPQIKIKYNIKDVLPAVIQDYSSEWTEEEIAGAMLEDINVMQASSYKTYGQNNSAAQKRLVQEYMEENESPCFDFVKFFAKDVWRDIQKDIKEFAKEIHQFNTKYNSNTDS